MPQNKECGYVLVVMAAFLVLLLGFSALAVDVGIMYSSHTAAQRAADSAALAGAFTFINDAGVSDPEALAYDRALRAAKANQILGQFITDSEVNINIEYDLRRVTVDVTRSAGTFFAKALFMDSTTVHARGIAEASKSATGAKCVKPWFLPNSVLSSLGPCYACQSANQASSLIIFPDANHTINQDMLDDWRGNEFTISPANQGQGGTPLAPGQFYAIDLANSPTGGADYRAAIAGCPPEATNYCFVTYSTKTGAMVGLTREGLYGWGQNLGLMPDPPDTYSRFDSQWGFFFHPGGDTSKEIDTSPQMVLAPIWDVCTSSLDCSDPDKPQFPSGTQATVPVVGFALVFIKGMQGNNVKAQLLDVKRCDAVPPSTNETGPFGIPLRLVRVD